jgi:hypothetical protein
MPFLVVYLSKRSVNSLICQEEVEELVRRPVQMTL